MYTQRHHFNSIPAIALVALGAACGGFDNRPLMPPPSPPTAVDAAGQPQVLQKAPLALTVSPHQGALTSVHLGHVYATKFTASPVLDGISGCWSVVAGELPPGLHLDSFTGELRGHLEASSSGQSSFRVQVSQPCGAAEPVAVGRSEWLTLAHGGRCQWNLDCAVGESCTIDGSCRVDLSEQCPRSVGPALRFVPGAGRGAYGPGPHLWQGARVAEHGFARAGSNGAAQSCRPSDHELVLAYDGGREVAHFCYRLPGELRLPIDAGDVIDFAIFEGAFDEQAVFLRRHGDEPNQPLSGVPWTWAAWSGRADASAGASALCTSKGICPLLSGAQPVLGSGCRLDGPCDVAMSGLRLPTQSKVLWPGQVAPWGQDVTGKPLYSALLARGFSEEPCDRRAATSGFTWLMLEGAAPHPLLSVESTDLTLDSVPRWVSVDGTASVPTAPAAGNTTYLDAFYWNVEGPPGHPRLEFSTQDTQPSFPAYLAGEYAVSLAVRDSKSGKTSAAEAMARLSVRPEAAVHVEAVWDSPNANVNLMLLPPHSAGQWGRADAGKLWEGEVPSWAQGAAATGPRARLIAQPDGHPLEVLRVSTDLAMEGPLWIALDQTGGSEPVRVSVQVYVHGQRVDQGAFQQIRLGPQDILPLAKVDAASGQLLPW